MMSELKQMQRSSNDRRILSVQVEERVVELWDDGLTVGFIAKKTMIHRNSVRKILKKYKKKE